MVNRYVSGTTLFPVLFPIQQRSIQHGNLVHDQEARAAYPMPGGERQSRYNVLHVQLRGHSENNLRH